MPESSILYMGLLHDGSGKSNFWLIHQWNFEDLMFLAEFKTSHIFELNNFHFQTAQKREKQSLNYASQNNTSPIHKWNSPLRHEPWLMSSFAYQQDLTRPAVAVARPGQAALKLTCKVCECVCTCVQCMEAPCAVPGWLHRSWTRSDKSFRTVIFWYQMAV